MPTIAIIGASSNRSKFGNKAVRAYLRKGWTVVPVNPSGGEIEGLPVLASIRELEMAPDRVTLYLPPERGMALLEDIAAIGPGELFLNPGTESPALVARAGALGLRVTSGCAIVDIGESPALL